MGNLLDVSVAQGDEVMLFILSVWCGLARLRILEIEGNRPVIYG